LWWITHSCFIPFIPFIPRCRGGIGKSHHKAQTWSFKGPETKTAQEVSSKSCDLWYSSALLGCHKPWHYIPMMVCAHPIFV
jgi:hypothetical protein